jgi:ectoine hydroxylase-related dioxygenase (phytanoyl-CoA dioxygenase family)
MTSWSTDPSVADTYRAQGAVVLRGLLESSWIDQLRGIVEELLAQATNPTERLGGAAASTSRASDGMWRRNDAFARFLHASPVATAAGDVMGSATVRLYEDLFLYTDPGVPGANWHRDAPHWPVMGTQLSSIWFTLEPVTLETGALHFVTGSHVDDDETVAAEQMVGALGDDRAATAAIVGFETEPGDAIAFHPRILHRAVGTSPDHPRRTFTIRFTGDDIRWRPRSSYFHPWMRDAGFARGSQLDHPWFPMLRSSMGSSTS